MRILVVSNFYPPRAVGGAEIVAHRHARDLVRRGHQVAVFAGRVPKSDQTGGEITLESIDGIDVHLVSIRSLETERNFHWEAAGRLFRSVLGHFQPEVVHFHNLMGLGVNLILEAKRYGAKTVCTVHDHWGFCSKNTLLITKSAVCTDHERCHFCNEGIVDEKGKAIPSRLRRDYVMFCLSQVDHLVFPSRYLLNAYLAGGFNPTKMHHISNGVELNRFKSKPETTPKRPLHIVVIGYLGEHKGVDVVLAAINKLAEDQRIDASWRVSIVGDGHLRGQVQAAASGALANHCEFLGKLPSEEIPDLLHEADVVLLPSVWPENEPVVMLEAIASGTAQLASDIGGHLELIVDGKSGQFFHSGDPDDLAKKLRNYITHAELAGAHGI